MESFKDWLLADSQAGWGWLWVLLIPLTTAGIVAGLVVYSGQSTGLTKHAQDKNVRLPVGLTFLGAAVAGIAQFDIFKNDSKVAADVGILLVANVIFAALAASNGLMEGFGKDRDIVERLRTVVVLWASIGSLLSGIVLIWRTPADLIPGWVKILLSAMVLVAVIMVSAYERNRFQEPRQSEAPLG